METLQCASEKKRFDLCHFLTSLAEVKRMSVGEVEEIRKLGIHASFK